LNFGEAFRTLIRRTAIQMAAKKRQPTPSPPLKPALSPGKRFVFRLVALALPVLVFGLAELGLRLAGYGGYPPMLQKVGPVPGGSLVIADQAGASSWFFASPNLTGRNEQCAFLDPKPTNTVRIFCVGESAMQGYPQPRHLASSAFLQKMLEDVWPARQVEVINLGTTAIASFPVLGIMTEALEFEPDLMVIYTGNNEFFGTYGVASAGRAGGKPWMLRANRFLHSLALVQGLGRLLASDSEDFDHTLMETMMAQNYIGPDDWRRQAAADILHHNLAEMIRRCRARGVPVLVCTLPANERDLAPIGNDKLDELPVDVQTEVKSLLSTAEMKLRESGVESALPALQRVLKLCPKHARAHFLLGKCFGQSGKVHEALEQFVAARDLDTMPWRPPSLAQDAVLRAAHDENAPVCDLFAAFRAASPGGAIGWELMDDHVHPALRGQALIAESIVNSLANFDGGLRVSPEARAGLSLWTEYARRLGTNDYDRFGVAHNLRLLFNAAFMRANNPQAYERFNAIASGIENQMSADVRATMREWQATRPFAGSRCPITAAVAQLELKQDAYQSALDHYEIARRAVPQYTSWYLEYTYYVLYCQQKLRGVLAAPEKNLAQAAIQQGHFLSPHVVSDTGFIERYTGLLHLLCGEFSEAIPYLAASRGRQTGFDRVVVDQTLMVCYLQTRQFGKAREVLTAGLASAGEHAERYRALLQQLPALEKALMEQTNSTGRPLN
jgi:tetratricopeptide (TPR) repeat protein